MGQPHSAAAFSLDFASLISPDASRISRRIFADPEIYQHELRGLFQRCWIFVGHESQVPAPGDFAAAYIGEEPVILARGMDGQIRVLLNSCSHRGTRICRVDRGNAATLSCPNHGWTYGIDGKLLGVPGLEKGYQGDLKKSDWDLQQPAHVDSYAGLIFATFDSAAPTLRAYLGDAVFYLDAAFDRYPNGIEFLGGIQKWIVECNWKFFAENYSADIYHADAAHVSTFSITGLRSESQIPHGIQVTTASGHGIVASRFPEQSNPIDRLPGSATHLAPDLSAYLRSVQAQAELRLGPVRALLKPITGTIFPNFAILPSVSSVRIAHPRGPHRTEIWSWCFVPAAAPAQVKQSIRRIYASSFGPGGLVEAEDFSNWTEMSRGCRSEVAERPLHLGMGLGREYADPDLPGSLAPLWSEHNQRGFYKTWRRCMSEVKA